MIHNVTLSVTCMTCYTDDTVTVTVDDYKQYSLGNKLVQQVWPTFSTWEREVIIGSRTGVFQCQDCWIKEGDEE